MSLFDEIFRTSSKIVGVSLMTMVMGFGGCVATCGGCLVLSSVLDSDTDDQPDPDLTTGQPVSPSAIGPLPDDLTWATISDERFRHYKRSVEIQLSREVSKETLRTLATRIHSASGDVERTFIGYYVGENREGGYWATTHYDPHLNVVIRGTTIDERRGFRDSLPPTYDGFRRVGVWLLRDNTIGDSRISVHESRNGARLVEEYSDGSVGEYPLKKRDRAGRYYRVQSPAEWVAVGPTGDLQHGDQDGIYKVAAVWGR